MNLSLRDPPKSASHVILGVFSCIYLKLPSWVNISSARGCAFNELIYDAVALPPPLPLLTQHIVPRLENKAWWVGWWLCVCFLYSALFEVTGNGA